jgi:hypothetical protein
MTQLMELLLQVRHMGLMGSGTDTAIQGSWHSWLRVQATCLGRWLLDRRSVVYWACGVQESLLEPGAHRVPGSLYAT